VKANTLGGRRQLLFEADLPESAAAVRKVRHAAMDAIRGHPTAEVAQIVISELATNAVRHAGCPCTLRVFDGAQTLLIEVQDSSPRLPVVGPDLQDNIGSSGRGLQIVKALSDRFGVKPSQKRGKTVWARICC
jgi:anti-sigma regulatory factor (Ser/Thr protein kinase)